MTYNKASMSRLQPKVVVIGGGTGSFTILQALKAEPLEITALVNMADDGGSTGRLRDELGVLPPGDIRQCLVALSDAPAELRELFNFRFPSGALEGHSFGNIFLSAVESMTHDFNEAVRMASDILRIRGRVLPITTANCQLVMEVDGHITHGEDNIGKARLAPGTQPKLHLEPHAQLTAEARQAVLKADLVIIAPGDLYTSLAPALLVDGLPLTLAETAAPIAYICNLVNKPAQTPKFAVHDYAREIERIIGQPFIDYVLYNTDPPTPELLKRYATEGEYPVSINEHELLTATYESIPGHFLSHETGHHPRHAHQASRSLIRHDGAAIASSLRRLLQRIQTADDRA